MTIKHPIVRPIGDPARQPKVAVSPTSGFGNKKAPCRFCQETRKKIVKVAASWFKGRS
jgi:hypothetical protein